MEVNFIYLIGKELSNQNLKDKMYQFLLFFQPLIFLTLFYFMASMRGIELSFNAVILISIFGMWGYVLYSSGSALVSQKWSNTLNLLIASPTSLYKILLAKIISNSFVSLITLIINILYSQLIFRIKFELPNIWLFILSTLTLIIALASIGFILAIILLNIRNVPGFQNIILTPIILMSGVFLPLDKLPYNLEYISALLPISWAIKFIKLSISNQFSLIIFLVSIFLSLVYFVAGVILIKKIEKNLKELDKMEVI